AFSIRLGSTVEIEAAIKTIDAMLHAPIRATRQPHVSLYYGSAPPRPDQFSMELPETLMFDSISILEFESNLQICPRLLHRAR
ncbi:MAG: hypothetical protein AAFX02_11870, partial [Pseudomonadota bacterium]